VPVSVVSLFLVIVGSRDHKICVGLEGLPQRNFDLASLTGKNLLLVHSGRSLLALLDIDLGWPLSHIAGCLLPEAVLVNLALNLRLDILEVSGLSIFGLELISHLIVIGLLSLGGARAG
jgi:hypothetical protein